MPLSIQTSPLGRNSTSTGSSPRKRNSPNSSQAPTSRNRSPRGVNPRSPRGGNQNTGNFQSRSSRFENGSDQFRGGFTKLGLKLELLLSCLFMLAVSVRIGERGFEVLLFWPPG